MEKHILICGERGVGKSTLIRRLLAESILPVGGFVTRRLPQADGDGMFPIYLHAAALPPEERPYALGASGGYLRQPPQCPVSGGL